MTKYDNDPAVVRDLLHTRATWAVVGLSQNRSPHRVLDRRRSSRSSSACDRPRAPAGREVLGREGYASLADIPDGTDVDVVDCFVNSGKVGAVVDEAIAEQDRLGIGAIWMQLGVVDEAAAARARAGGVGRRHGRLPADRGPAPARATAPADAG